MITAMVEVFHFVIGCPYVSVPVTTRCFQVTWDPSVLSSLRKSFATDWATAAAELNYFTQGRKVTMIATTTMTTEAAKQKAPIMYTAIQPKKPILKCGFFKSGFAPRSSESCTASAE